MIEDHLELEAETLRRDRESPDLARRRARLRSASRPRFKGMCDGSALLDRNYLELLSAAPDGSGL